MFRFFVMVLVLGFISCSGEKGDSSSGGELAVSGGASKGGASSVSEDKGQAGGKVQSEASLLASVLPSFRFAGFQRGHL